MNIFIYLGYFCSKEKAPLVLAATITFIVGWADQMQNSRTPGSWMRSRSVHGLPSSPPFPHGRSSCTSCRASARSSLSLSTSCIQILVALSPAPSSLQQHLEHITARPPFMSKDQVSERSWMLLGCAVLRDNFVFPTDFSLFIIKNSWQQNHRVIE